MHQNLLEVYEKVKVRSTYLALIAEGSQPSTKGLLPPQNHAFDLLTTKCSNNMPKVIELSIREFLIATSLRLSYGCMV